MLASLVPMTSRPLLGTAPETIDWIRAVGWNVTVLPTPGGVTSTCSTWMPSLAGWVA